MKLCALQLWPGAWPPLPSTAPFVLSPGHERREDRLATESGGGWFGLGDAPEILRSDREVVLKAVAQCGWALRHAAETLKSNREVVLTAVGQTHFALQYAADVLLEDEGFAVDARQLLYFFKVSTALSGRSCIIAKPLTIGYFPGSARDLVESSCRKLGLQSTGGEKLLFGDAVVPEAGLGAESL
eukprot:810826-Amphidinium_carterae.1